MRTLIMPSRYIFRQSKAEPSDVVSTIPDMPLEVRKNGTVAEEFLSQDGAMLFVKCTPKWEVFRLGAMLAGWSRTTCSSIVKIMRLESKPYRGGALSFRETWIRRNTTDAGTRISQLWCTPNYTSWSFGLDRAIDALPSPIQTWTCQNVNQPTAAALRRSNPGNTPFLPNASLLDCAPWK